MNEDAEPVTSLVALMDRLVDPVPPPPVPMTPQTVGWAVLAGLVVLAVGALLWRWWRHRRANAYRREALAALGAAEGDAAAIATLLRRTALAVWPRDEVAALSGEAWLAFLDRTGGDGGFSGGAGRALLTAPYRPEGDAAAPELAVLAARWIRRHRGPRRDRGALTTSPAATPATEAAERSPAGFAGEAAP